MLDHAFIAPFEQENSKRNHVNTAEKVKFKLTMKIIPMLERLTLFGFVDPVIGNYTTRKTLKVNFGVYMP